MTIFFNFFVELNGRYQGFFIPPRYRQSRAIAFKAFASKLADMHISSLIDELEDAIASGSPQKRLQSLWRVVDLFDDGTTRYSDEQVALFDDVIMRLSAEIEAKARAKLARRMAPIANPPAKLIRSLAFDDDAAVAGPVLSRSPGLSEADLVATATSKSQDHLYAITQRESLSVAVTDVLVDRGDRHVVHSVVKNTGARFSDAGFGKLVARSRGDADLALRVGGRRDIPRQHFLKLVETASASVRSKLEAANPELAGAVHDAVADVVGKLRSDLRNASADYVNARAQVERLRQLGRLGEADIYNFARERKFEQTAVALSLLCDIPVDVVERALLDENADMVLILVRAAQCSWTTAKALLLMQAADRGIAAQDLDRALRSFQRLTSETAQRVLEFYLVRCESERTGAASGLERVATVDDERLRGDHAVVGAQKQDGAGDVLGSAVALQ